MAEKLHLQRTSVSVTQEEIHLPIPQLVYFSHDLYCTSNTNSLVNIVTERLAKHLLVDILIGVQSQGFRLRINAEFATYTQGLWLLHLIYIPLSQNCRNHPLVFYLLLSSFLFILNIVSMPPTNTVSIRTLNYFCVVDSESR